MINVRASSLPDLFDCPSRWAAVHIFKKRLPSSPGAVLGKSVHAGTAAYDSAVLLGSPITVDDAAAAAVDAIHKPNEDVDWAGENKQEVENIALDLHRLYCREIAPTQEYLAVEAKCEKVSFSDLGISLTGTVDRVRLTPLGLGIVDIKTGKTAVSANGEVAVKGHAAQMATYELLASASLGQTMQAPAQVIGLQAGKTAKGQRAASAEIDGTRDLLIGDEYCPGLLHHAASIIKSGMFVGNPRSMLCDKKYCPVFGQCRWRK